jgi:hypothetical protein
VNNPLVCGFNQTFVAHRDLILSDHFLKNLLVFGNLSEVVIYQAIKVGSCLVGLGFVSDRKIDDVVFIKYFQLIFETVAPVTVLG